MSIVAQCPHCETKFNLAPEMAGKSMRCPNLECRKTFTVKSFGRAVEPPPPPPPEPAPLPPEPAVPSRPAKPDKPAKPRKRVKPVAEEPEVVEAKVVEAAVVSPPKVKEVVWTEGTDVPPPKARKAARAEEPDESDDSTPLPRRRRKKKRGPWVLIGMSVAALGLVAFGAIYLLKFRGEGEALLAAQAKEEYKKGDFPAAQKSYDKLAADYPDGPNSAEYKFFAGLSAVQVSAKAVTNRENFDAALAKFNSFVEVNKDSPFAKHTSGYGRDIVEIGKKLGEDIASHAEDRVKAYRADRTKSDELDRADKAIAAGRALLDLIDPFRAPDDSPLDTARGRFDEIEKSVKHQRDRTAALAKAAAGLERLSDTAIQQVEADLTLAGFANDEEAKALLADAKGRLREMVKYVPDPAPARAAPASAAATVLFVAPVGNTKRPPSAASDTEPSIFLCVARGILYAIEEDTAALAWAVRVGPDVTDPPAVARVQLDSGPTDLAVVTLSGGDPALVGYDVKTGEARWYQPLGIEVSDPADAAKTKWLPVPAAGPAVVVGGRAYVALRDPEGTIYDFDLTTGERKGRIRLGQHAGPGAAVRPGTGLLYAVADARRVYVIDVGAKDDDGNRLSPVCVQVIATNHPPGTVRTTPVLLGPEGDTLGERWMVLAQADGPTTTKLRAFPLLPPAPPAADGKPPAETPAAPSIELVVPGWVWFPPASDGERLALVTDSGQFRLFGVNQPGNFDKVLFPLPSVPLPAPPDGTATPGLVLPAEEGTFWVLANGSMQKFRLWLAPARGLEVVAAGPRVPVGIPTQAPQVNARKDSACLVVRSPSSAGYRAVLVNLRDGEFRWQRQLGIFPAVPPIPQENGVLLTAEDGGLVAVPAGSAAPGRTTVAPQSWLIADAPENATGPTAVAVSADGKTVFTVTPVQVIEESKPVARWLVRRVTNGQLAHTGLAPAPDAIAGTPVVLGGSLLIPASDGFVHRHVPGTGRANPDTLTAGPKWTADQRPGVACFITVVSDTAFFTNDGGKKFAQWDWPKAGRLSPVGSPWELRERPAGPGVVLPPAGAGDQPRLLIADVTGSVWLYPTGGGPQLRRWRPGTGIPAGKPTSPFVLQPDATGRTVVAYSVENKFLVCLDPEREVPRWAVKVGDDADAVLVGPPRPTGAGRWLVTELGGRVALFGSDGGKVDSFVIGVPGTVPAVAAGSAGAGGVLAPLSDGSAVVLALPAAPEPEAKKD